MYHDAISELLSDDEVADISSSRIRKRNRCISLLESMKRVQQAQTAVSANSSHSDQLPTEWMEQSKTTQANDSNVSSTLSSALECRFCAKPFVYESTLIEHEELHAKGVVTDNDSIEDVEQIGHKEHVGHEQLVPSSTPQPTRQTSTPIPILSPDPVSASAPVIPTSVSAVAPPSIPSAASASSPTAEPSSAPAPVVDPIPTHTSTSSLAPTPALVPAPVPAPTPAPALVPVLALALAPSPALALSPIAAPATVPTTAPADDPASAPPTATNIVSSSISPPSSTPTHSLTPTSTSTSAHVPAPTPAQAPSSVLIPAPPSAPAHTSTPTPSSVSAPAEAPTPTISASVLPNPNPTSVSTAGQIIDNSMVSQEEYAAHTVPSQDNSHSQHTVDTVSLTDVTAMLLEGAFEGVRPISNSAASLCRFCQEPFSGTDLLRRHERLYCNQKPSLIKHKQPLQPQQQLHIQLNSQQPPQPSVDTPLPTGGHTQHHLILHQQQSQSIGNLPAAQQPTEQADQQIIYSQRVVIEATPMEVPRSCKYCHKDFIHRGSLWRHQMFCDANPEKDLNRIVAGSKKKVVVAKSCNQRKDVQQHNTIPVVANHPNNSGGTQMRRGSINQPNSGPLKYTVREHSYIVEAVGIMNKHTLALKSMRVVTVQRHSMKSPD
ncbi:hypothetical protein FOCC_FOCC007289 [Frankliniella occidentalis]|nr:hypothetical protein FOCC_FOCC007289 [Frankliniella occidentalis]